MQELFFLILPDKRLYDTAFLTHLAAAQVAQELSLSGATIQRICVQTHATDVAAFIRQKRRESGLAKLTWQEREALDLQPFPPIQSGRSAVENLV